MLNNATFEVFTKPVKDYYDELKKNAEAKIKEVKAETLSPEDFEKKINEIMSVYLIPELNFPEPEKHLEHNEEPNSLAANFFSTFTWSSSSNTTMITTAKYTYKNVYNYGFLLTNNYNKRTFRGQISGLNVTFFYYRQGQDMNVLAPSIKNDHAIEKSALIENNKAVVQYLTDQKPYFYSFIKTMLENQLYTNSQHRSNLEML